MKIIHILVSSLYFKYLSVQFSCNSRLAYVLTGPKTCYQGHSRAHALLLPVFTYALYRVCVINDHLFVFLAKKSAINAIHAM